jgi:glycosyltransferase involved in cell wall biosynthesis
VLIDVTRLIWRAWRGRHPTGIDRVCLAYLDHFRDRALAVIQRKGLVLVLSKARSGAVFELLLEGQAASRPAIVRTLARAVLDARRSPPRQGMLYLNVGHTGLNDRSLSNWITRNGVGAVHLVHDLIPITNPEFCRPGEAVKHRRRITNALESATGIIANSQATLDELADFAATRSLKMPSRVAAWIAGLDHPGDVGAAPLKEPYFVTVGTIEGRKNHQLLLDVWHRLVSEHEDAPVLVVIGQRGWQAERVIEKLDSLGDLQDRVREVRACDDEELASWIAGARAVLMPSFAEGFGLPVIEALALGTPVIASNLPVFREIAGDVPTFLEPTDVEAWVERIHAFIHDDPDRVRQSKEMIGYRAPTWQQHFEKVEAWLATL